MIDPTILEPDELPDEHLDVLIKFTDMYGALEKLRYSGAIPKVTPECLVKLASDLTAIAEARC